MAEVMENAQMHSNKGKLNAALTTGIIGTSLSGLLTLGAMGIGSGIIGNNKGCPGVPTGDLYNERKETQDYFRRVNYEMHKLRQGS